MKVFKIISITLFLCVFMLITADWIFLAKEQYKAEPVSTWLIEQRRGMLSDPLQIIDTNISPVKINEKQKTINVSGFPYRYINLIDKNNLSYKVITDEIPVDKKKKPVIFMGCSFIYGLPLFGNETLPYKVAEYAKRKVLNLGYPMEGIQHVLYKIQKAEDFNENIKDAEYVIYLFMTDHLRRMYCNYFSIGEKMRYLQYKKTKNGLKLINPDKVSFLDYIKTTYTAKKFNNLMFSLKSDNEKFDLLKLYLEECKKSIESKNPNCKMVVIVYNSSKSDIHNIFPFRTDRWKELEDEGFIVINFDTEEYDYLAEKEYVAEDHAHPSAKAWATLAPIIAKKLNL